MVVWGTMNATPTAARILKAKTRICCDLCGVSMPRAKSFKVEAVEMEAAKIEAAEKIARWKASLKGQNCRVCQSIING